QGQKPMTSIGISMIEEPKPTMPLSVPATRPTARMIRNSTSIVFWSVRRDFLVIGQIGLLVKHREVDQFASRSSMLHARALEKRTRKFQFLITYLPAMLTSYVLSARCH